MRRARFIHGTAGVCTVMLLTIYSARAGVVHLSDLTAQTCGGGGCWTLQDSNGDGSVGAPANSFVDTSQLGVIALTGSDVNFLNVSSFLNGRTIDIFQQWMGPLVDYSQPASVVTQPGLAITTIGVPLGTLSTYSTVITDGTAGDLTFQWAYQTLDSGSFFDPAGYYYCSAASASPDVPSGTCGLFQLTSDFNALTANGAPDPGPPYREFGTQTLSLSAGDTFGLYVMTLDNANGPGTIAFSDVPTTATPEPTMISVCLSGLILLLYLKSGRARTSTGSSRG